MELAALIQLVQFLAVKVVVAIGHLLVELVVLLVGLVTQIRAVVVLAEPHLMGVLLVVLVVQELLLLDINIKIRKLLWHILQK